MPTKNVNLSAQQARFIHQSVNRGGFQNASEVVRAGLRLLEQQQQAEKLKLQALQKMLKAGFDDIDRGAYEMVDLDNLDQFVDKVDSRARKLARR